MNNKKQWSHTVNLEAIYEEQSNRTWQAWIIDHPKIFVGGCFDIEEARVFLKNLAAEYFEQAPIRKRWNFIKETTLRYKATDDEQEQLLKGLI